jgi:hypothetical protein
MTTIVDARRKRFQLVLIKPSHYDEDGYVIQWLRSAMPSNSLAVVYGLAADAANRRVLGANVAIDIVAIDETNQRIRTDAVIRRIKGHRGFGMVGLVGVQSNEFPRAVDIAAPLRRAGINVVIGGFHVSGCLSMLPELPPDIQAALDMGVPIFAGEAEGQLDGLLLDAANGRLKPIYNCMADLPNLASATTPYLPQEFVKRVIGNVTSFDAGRGCPFQCSFCTIINVQGRISRRRTRVEAIIRLNWKAGVDRFFITDDNFARNKDWEAILDRIIELREQEDMDVRFMIQVDTLCHRIPNSIEKCRRAGVTRVFIGLENINPAHLLAAKKRQNKITEYRRMLLDWKDAGIMTFAGYILGFPNDTPESILHDIDIIKRELPLDLLEFFILTPLPGSEDHKLLAEKGVWMDSDMNKYELEHVVTAHAKMTPEEWQGIYKKAWEHYYKLDHLEAVLRRAAASGIRVDRLPGILLWFLTSAIVENVHPLQGGLVRRKHRRDRRPGMPIASPLAFYPAIVSEFFRKHAALARYWWHFRQMRKRAERESAMAANDLAMQAVITAST